jgi:hypothetical protein
MEQSQDRMTLFLKSSLDTSKFGNPDLTLLIPVERPVVKITRDEDTMQDVAMDALAYRPENKRLVLNVPCTTKRVQLFLS